MNRSSLENADMGKARELIARLCEGIITQEQATALQSLVLKDPKIRRLYILTMTAQADLYMQAALLSPSLLEIDLVDPEDQTPPSMNDSMILCAIRDEHEQADQQPPSVDSDDRHHAVPNGQPLLKMVRWRWIRAAAIMLILSIPLTKWFVLRHPDTTAHNVNPRVPVVVETMPQSLARLDFALNPLWVDGQPAADGERISRGMVELKTGVGRLVMDSGVVVVLDGPTTLNLEDKSRLRLVNGRITLRVPHPATGFTVVTPSGNVSDIGTEFGVYVPALAPNQPPHTDMVVFDGAVRIEHPGVRDAPIARAGQGFSMTHSGIEPISDLTSAGTFVRNRDFERRRSALNSAKSIITNPDLLAYSFFDSEFDQTAARQNLPTGLHWKGVSANVRLADTSLGMGSPLGSTILLNGEDAAVVDLDTTVDSHLAEHGYIGSSGCVKSSGKILYLSWFSKALHSSSMGYGGLSLVYADQKQVSESVLFGQAPEVPNFSCRVSRDPRGTSGGTAGSTIVELNSAPASPEPRPLTVDNKMHLWVAKVQFDSSGADQISVYLDPGTDEPSQSNLLVQSSDLQFNRIRFASGPNSTWEFGRFLVGTTYDAVVPR